MRRRHAGASPGHGRWQSVCAALAGAIADAIRIVLEDYRRFVAGSGEDPKDFAGRHTAARAALAHLDQLRKLFVGEPGAEQAEDGADLLGQAKAALGLPPVEEEPSDDGGAGD